jgi:hypothetical protein
MKKLYITMLRRTLAALLLGSVVVQAKALTVDATESRYEASGIRYYFTVNWATSDRDQANPCISTDSLITVCRISLVAKHIPLAWYSVGSYPSQWEVPIRRSHSYVGDLLSDLMKVGFRAPLRGSILVRYESIAENKNICITFEYVRLGTTIGGISVPFGPTCARVVTPALQCEITGDSTINHRDLPDNKIDGASASTQLNLRCRGTASVTVTASRTNSSGVQLKSDGSLYSKVTINGKDATEGIRVDVTDGQTTKMDITSKLSSSGTVTPGKFSGSTVITISPP